MAMAALVIVVAGLKLGESILVPLVLGLFLAVLCLPAISLLQRIRVPSTLAVLIVLLAVVALLAGLGLIVGNSVQDFAANVPKYQDRFESYHASLKTWLASQGITLSMDKIYNAVNPGTLMGLFSKALARVASAVSYLLLVLFIVIFVLAEATGFRRKLRAALGPRSDRIGQLDQVVADVQRYLAWKTVISLATGILVAIWLAVLGVDYPVLWGLVAFLLNYVPNIGSIIAAVPPVLLAIIQFGLGRALAVAGGYVVVNTVMGNVVEPMVLGRKLGLSSLVVFLSLIVWGFIWGPVGMLLSVPLTVMVKIALENSEGLQWIATLMGPAPDDAPDG